MRRAEIMGLPPPRTGAPELTGAVDSRGWLINNANMRSRHRIDQLPHQSIDWTPCPRSGGKRSDAPLGGAATERAWPSPASHAAVEADRPALRVDVWTPVAMRSMSMDNAPRAGAAEPGLQPERLPAEHPSGG